MTAIQDHSAIVQVPSCYHCGEDCGGHSVHLDDHVFCCNGCKSVYEILNGCSLEAFYDLEKHPGQKPEGAKTYDFLLLDEVRQSLIRFENDDYYKIQVCIPGIHCSSCIYLLEQLHRLDPGILNSTVDFQRKELQLTIEKREGIFQDVFQLLGRLGYTPMLPEKAREGQKRDSRNLLVRIGITGFCFGNIMLLSFPEYVSGGVEIEASYERLFNALIIALTIPALYFGAKDYFFSAWSNLRHRHLGVDVPIVLGISAMFVRSIYEIALLGQPGYFDSLAGFLFFLLIGKWFQSRTYEHLSFDKDVNSFLPLAVLKKTGEEYHATGVKELKKGDIIRLRNGEVLPVNALLLEDAAAFDYSFVTGESATVNKHLKEALYAGGRLLSPTASLMVQDAVDQSYLQHLWKGKDTAVEAHPAGEMIDNISKHFTLAVLVIATAALVYWTMAAGVARALEVFTAILIVACPCALALAAPFTYGNAGRWLSKIGVYLKHPNVVERLSDITHLVFDKTGTMTQKSASDIEYHGRSAEEHLAAFSAVASCSMHPLSKAMVQFWDIGHTDVRPEEFTEAEGAGLRAVIDGDRYLIGSRDWMEAHGLKVPSGHQEADAGRTKVHIARNDEYYGCYEFSNVYRPGLLASMRSMASEYKLSVLSGDGPFEKAFLQKALGTEVPMRFQQHPADKLEYITGLKEAGRVMMLGDGINDAAALKASDIGVAITEDTASFTPNSDIIMKAESLSLLPRILQFGKDSKRVLYGCLVLSLLYNLIGLAVAFNGWLTPFVAAILMPVSSVTIVLVATGMTGWYAKKRKLL